MHSQFCSSWNATVRRGQLICAILGLVAYALVSQPLSAAPPPTPVSPIKVTPETKARADAILKAIFALESEQSNKNTAEVERLRVKLVKELSGSQLAELPEWKAYILAWERLLAQRGKQYSQSTVGNSSTEKSKDFNAGGKVDGKEEAQFSFGKQDSAIGAGRKVGASAEVRFSSISSEKQATNTTTIVGGSMGDSELREGKGRSLNELLTKIRQLGFSELVSQQELVGYWNWTWTGGGGPDFVPVTVLLELRPDGTLLARFTPTTKQGPGVWTRQTWGGTWSVSEGKLSARITGYWAAWKSFVTTAEAQGERRLPEQLHGELIPKRTITFGTTERIILDGECDNTLERAKQNRTLMPPPAA